MLRMSLRPAHMYVVSLFGMGTKVQTDVVRETAEATVEYQLRLERLQWFAHLQRISTYRTTAFRSRCRSVDSRKAEGDGRFKHGNHSCTDRDCHCGVTLFLNLVNVPKIYKKMHGGVKVSVKICVSVWGSIIANVRNCVASWWSKCV